MAETTLLALALAVQDAHARLASAVDGVSEEANMLVTETKRRLDLLVVRVREREDRIEAMHDALADRMNNLLMAIRTASDLLRNPASADVALVREKLDATVETGRQAVKRLQDTLDTAR
jgi:hypothetical protein